MILPALNPTVSGANVVLIDIFVSAIKEWTRIRRIVSILGPESNFRKLLLYSFLVLNQRIKMETWYIWKLNIFFQ